MLTFLMEEVRAAAAERLEHEREIAETDGAPVLPWSRLTDLYEEPDLDDAA